MIRSLSLYILLACMAFSAFSRALQQKVEGLRNGGGLGLRLGLRQSGLVGLGDELGDLFWIWDMEYGI